MTNRFHKLIIYLVLLLPEFALAENMKLEVIPLQHRMVDDVVHIIRPLITPGGIVTGRLGEWMELGGIDLKAFIRIPDKTLPLLVAVDRKYALY